MQPFTESRESRSLAAPLRLLWPIIKPYGLHLALAGGAVVIASSTVLTFGWGLRNLIDHGFHDDGGAYLNRALLILLAVILVLAAASYARFYLVWRVAERMIMDLRKKIYLHLLALDPAYFELHKTGEHVSRINADTTVLQMVVTTNVPTAFRHILMLAGGIVMMFVVSPSMTLMASAVVPLIMAPIIYFGRGVRSKSR